MANPISKPKGTKRPQKNRKPVVPLNSSDSHWVVHAAAAFGVKWKAVCNVLCSLGPRMLSLWPSASKNLLTHQTHQSAIEGVKQAITLENENFAAVEREILEQIPKAKPEDFLNLQKRLELLRGYRCFTEVIVKSLDYVNMSGNFAFGTPNPSKRNDFTGSPSPAKPTSTITEHWMDLFTRVARQRNEPWRSELLARVLAAESENPGSVPTRALWVIGTMEEAVLREYECWLNNCMIINDAPVCAWNHVDSFDCVRVKGGKERLTIGDLRSRLSEAGLIIHFGELSCRTVGTGVVARCQKGSVKVTVKQSTSLVIPGAWCTRIGAVLSKYHEYKPTKLAQKTFEKWKKHISSVPGISIKIIDS
ncbi:MAG: DUF2806 domain-containing protein [Verrucomicrobiaceae bacterium]|nr:DUF2806 domain-containing protein [Verrucomicrobiaceae bacterium]